MAIEIKTSKRGNGQWYQEMIVVSGDSGVGKTSFLKQCVEHSGGKCLVLSVDPGGVSHIDGIDYIDVESASWPEILKTIKELDYKQLVKDGYTTIAIDSLTFLAAKIGDHIIKAHGVKELADIGFGGGYGELNKSLKDLIQLAKRVQRATGLGWIFTCHTRKDVDDKRKVTVYPDMPDKARNLVVGGVDHSLWLTSNLIEKGGKAVISRRLSGVASKLYPLAKSRGGAFECEFAYTPKNVLTLWQRYIGVFGSTNTTIVADSKPITSDTEEKNNAQEA